MDGCYASDVHKGISDVTLVETENPEVRRGLWRKSKRSVLYKLIFKSLWDIHWAGTGRQVGI